MGQETAFWIAALLVAGAMAGITLLALALWRTKHVAQQAGAAVLFIESLALSGLTVPFVVHLLSGSGTLSPEPPLRLWAPAVAGVAIAAIAAIAAAIRPKGASGRPITMGNRQ